MHASLPYPSFGKALAACFRPTVYGRPRWLAQYLGQGLCRIKWLSSAAIVVWIAQAFGLTLSDVRGLYENAAAHLGIGVSGLIWSAVATGIAGAFYVLPSGRDGLSIARARRLATVVALTTVASEAFLFGFARLAAQRVASLDLALLVVLAVMPAGLIAGLLVATASQALVYGSAAIAGLDLTAEHALFMIHPLSFAALGMVANRWYVGAFKGEQLGRLRLQRHMRQVERQKILIEAQKDEALRQRAEIERQRVVLFQALSSALTAPVAHAYVDRGHFPTELKTVCVIACDAVGFSDTCRKLQPERVVFELENFFREFDAACLKCRVEPLRAQGDGRIAIAGLWPGADRQLHQEAISAVLAMLYFRSVLPGASIPADGTAATARVLWPARIGISLGPASCGVIDTGVADSPGTSGRLWFDVWGDTVNLAARLEQAAKPNQVLVRESVLWETRGLFDHGPIQQMQVKSTTLSDAAEIIGIRAPFRDAQGMPNADFWKIFNERSVRPVRPDPKGTVTAIADAASAAS